MLKNKVAFIGRSNVGKSSLINYLVGQKVALTSKHPGKTRKHAIIPLDTKTEVVDMPGYGYSTVRMERRQDWDENLQILFFEDRSIRQVFVLIDISIKPLKIDQDFVSWLVDHTLPFSIIYTKIDKIKLKEKNQNLALWKPFFDLLPHTLEKDRPHFFEVSALEKKGIGSIKDYIKSLAQL